MNWSLFVPLVESQTSTWAIRRGFGLGLAGAEQFSSTSFPVVDVEIWAGTIRTHPTAFYQFKINSPVSSTTFYFSSRIKTHWGCWREQWFTRRCRATSSRWPMTDSPDGPSPRPVPCPHGRRSCSFPKMPSTAQQHYSVGSDDEMMNLYYCCRQVVSRCHCPPAQMRKAALPRGHFSSCRPVTGWLGELNPAGHRSHRCPGPQGRSGSGDAVLYSMSWRPLSWSSEVFNFQRYFQMPLLCFRTEGQAGEPWSPPRQKGWSYDLPLFKPGLFIAGQISASPKIWRLETGRKISTGGGWHGLALPPDPVCFLILPGSGWSDCATSCGPRSSQTPAFNRGLTLLLQTKHDPNSDWS